MKRNSNRSRDVSLAEASRLLGRSRNALAAAIAEVMPARSEKGERGTIEWRLDLAKALDWYEQRAATRERERLEQKHAAEVEPLRRALEQAAGDGEPMSRSEALRRKAVALARLAEIDLALREGSVAPVAPLEFMLIELFSSIQQRLLAVPTRAALEAAVETEPAVVEEIIRRHQYEALEAIANDKEVVAADLLARAIAQGETT